MQHTNHNMKQDIATRHAISYTCVVWRVMGPQERKDYIKRHIPNRSHTYSQPQRDN